MSLGDKIENSANTVLGLSSSLAGIVAGGYAAHLAADIATVPEGASLLTLPGGLATGAAAGAQLTHRNNIGEKIDGLNPLHNASESSESSSYRGEDPLDTHPRDIKEIRSMLEPEEKEEIVEIGESSMTVHEDLDTVLNPSERSLLSKVFQPGYDPADYFSGEHRLFLTIGSEAKREDTSEAVEKIVYDEVKGLKGEYKLLDNNTRSSVFWATYVDQEQETLLQVPRDGEDFQDRIERVERVRENKKVLDQADQYIDQVLENKENQKIRHGRVDYEWLQKNEDIVRQEIEGGIETAADNYETIVVEANGNPVPVLVAEYNDEMDDWRDDTSYRENKNRFRAVGKYIDALIHQGIFTAVPNDYFDDYDGMNDMYIDSVTGEIGVSDLGELPGYLDNNHTRPDTPKVSVKS